MCMVMVYVHVQGAPGIANVLSARIDLEKEGTMCVTVYHMIVWVTHSSGAG